MAEHLRRKLAEKLHLHGLVELLVYRVHTLSACVSYRAYAVASDGALHSKSAPSNSHHHAMSFSHRYRSREVGNDETHSTTTQPPNQTPELARRRRILPLRHALLAQHLLEHAAKLLVAEPLPIRLRRRPVAVPLPAAEPKRRPGEPATAAAAAALLGRRPRHFLVGAIGERIRPGEAVEGARGVVVAAAGRVREGVVGVVDLLEALRACAALGTVGRDAVRVVFESGSVDRSVGLRLNGGLRTFCRRRGSAATLL